MGMGVAMSRLGPESGPWIMGSEPQLQAYRHSRSMLSQSFLSRVSVPCPIRCAEMAIKPETRLICSRAGPGTVGLAQQ
jgi:hypothetical protein